MRIGISAFARRMALLCLLASSFLILGKPANAVTVTVGSFVYDLQVESTGLAFTDPALQPTLETTPWWTSGDAGLTSSIADAYIAAAGAPTTTLVFAYASNPSPFISFGDAGFGVDFGAPAVDAILIPSAGSILPAGVSTGPVPITAAASSLTLFGGDFAFVTGTATPVPEINGPVLAQLTLIIGVLYLALLGLRRRRAVAPAKA